MQRIEIKTESFFVKTITKENGSVREMRLQPALFHRGDGAIFPFDVMLDRSQAPYKSGAYELSESSFLPDRYGVGFRPTVGAALDGKKV